MLGDTVAKGSRPRSIAYVIAVALVCCVSDGWSGKPSPLVHQLLLLPVSLAFAVSVTLLLRPKGVDTRTASADWRGISFWLTILVSFEAASGMMFLLESVHFHQFGYHLTLGSSLAAVGVAGICWCVYWRFRTGEAFLVAVLGTYAAGVILAIRDFPLNYMRSDMLPVIGWADGRLVRHLDPYTTMHVGDRLYDFPYLPGVLIAFAPARAMGLDLRWMTLASSLLVACLIFISAEADWRWWAAASTGVFLLCPFLQYRHDLYLQPHWLALTAAVVLMQRRHFIWSAMLWGMSCGIYQLSWVLVPFVVLYAYRRGSLVEAAKVLAAMVAGAFSIVGPFLGVAAKQVASNTVGQWSRMPHALAEPMNVSYWLTYLIRPDQLKWIQAVLLTALFAGCWWKGRCRTLMDTLRWMSVALAVFIPLNVLVDGYFYLTLLLLLLLYLCVANAWWPQLEGTSVLPKPDTESSVGQGDAA